ncbi:MAG: C_GCAxxG_C_C family protein [Anaerovibrio sp.]|nr:C_GCAxxG_C_C family protein [Anaerovibrio sp.]
MSKYTEQAQKLRDDTTLHYNCAQSVLIPFAEEMGLTREQAFDLGFNFGGGMKRASVCGAVTAGLMVLGLHGVNDVKILNEYHNTIKANHDGMLDCGDLLRISKEKGIEKKAHCDSLIKEVIELVEKYI